MSHTVDKLDDLLGGVITRGSLTSNDHCPGYKWLSWVCLHTCECTCDMKDSLSTSIPNPQCLLRHFEAKGRATKVLSYENWGW